MANTYFTTDSDYGDTPWPSLDQNTRDVYIPDLIAGYAEQSLWFGKVTYRYDLGALRTGRVVFTQRLKAPPNIAALDNRALVLPQIYTDSRSLEITCARYGDKIQLHKYDDLITQWRENGVVGLKAIINQDLAPHMIASLDLLARNAFLSGPFRSFAGGATGFDNLQADDTFDVGPLYRGIQLRVRTDRELRGVNPSCTTSPGAIYTIRAGASTTEWMERNQYANPGILIPYEVGSYESIQTAEHDSLTLYNVGEILQQTTIDATIKVGDGAPDPETTKVDDAWYVGQQGATHYITVGSTSGFAVGDIVTLHRARCAANGAMATADGVPWNHAANINCRIVALPTSTHMVFAEPVMADWYEAEVSTGLFGYVTKARPVHAAVFDLGEQGVVAGVIQPPEVHEPDSIDDTKSIYRVSWDAYLKYQQFFTKRVFVHFFAGPIVNGNAQVVNL